MSLILDPYEESNEVARSGIYAVMVDFSEDSDKEDWVYVTQNNRDSMERKPQLFRSHSDAEQIAALWREGNGGTRSAKVVLYEPLPDHLGGHNWKSWVDEGALNFMWDLGCRSMLDVGCGLGGQVELAETLGWRSYGIDGDWTVLPQKSNFFLNDYTRGYPLIEFKVDMIWSVEFLEHVESKYIDNYMTTFKNSEAKYAVVTYAPPGHGGHHHVNCQDQEYWVSVFEAYGFKLNQELSDNIRKVSTMKKPFLAKTGLVFEAGFNG